ncbi:hypothetical protein [Rahnella bonaserana]
MNTRVFFFAFFFTFP